MTNNEPKELSFFETLKRMSIGNYVTLVCGSVCAYVCMKLLLCVVMILAMFDEYVDVATPKDVISNRYGSLTVRGYPPTRWDYFEWLWTYDSLLNSTIALVCGVIVLGLIYKRLNRSLRTDE